MLDRATGRPKLNCINWECGVVLPVRAQRIGQTVTGKELEQSLPIEMQDFEDVVPVPMDTPGGALTDPWFFSER